MRIESRLRRLERNLMPRSRLCVLLNGKCVRGGGEPCPPNGYWLRLDGKGAGLSRAPSTDLP